MSIFLAHVSDYHPEEVCDTCGGYGEVYGHSDDCESDLCALAGGDVAAKGESFTLSDILDGEGLNARDQDEAVAVILGAALGAQRHRMREIVEDRCRQQQAMSDSRYKEGSHWRAQAYAAQVLRDLIAELDA